MVIVFFVQMPSVLKLLRSRVEQRAARTSHTYIKRSPASKNLTKRLLFLLPGAFDGFIQVLDAVSEVATGGDPELSLQDTPEGPCWVKV